MRGEEDRQQQILCTPFEPTSHCLTALLLLHPVPLSALVAIHCEFLTEVIQQFSQETGLSQPFICESNRGGCNQLGTWLKSQ